MAIMAVAVGTSGCDRLTGMSGRYPEGFRHGAGLDIAAQVMWLAAIGAMVGGAVLIGRGAWRVRRWDGVPAGDDFVWGAALLLMGAAGFVIVSIAALRLWLCHSACA